MVVDPENINMPYNFACVLASWIGDIEGALDMLESMIARQSRSLMLTMIADPDMDPLRDHPRFKSMVAKAMKRTGLTEEMLPEAARSSGAGYSACNLSATSLMKRASSPSASHSASAAIAASRSDSGSISDLA